MDREKITDLTKISLHPVRAYDYFNDYLGSKLWGVVNDIDSSDQELTEKIFDIILRIHHYKDQNQLINFIVQDLNGEISKEKVKGIFSMLSQKLKRY